MLKHGRQPDLRMGMITLSKRFFAGLRCADPWCTAAEGALWAHGDFWLVHCSPLNPVPGRFVLLVSCYDSAPAVAPDLAQVESIIESLAPVVPADDQDAFVVRAAILRAAAREFYGF